MSNFRSLSRVAVSVFLVAAVAMSIWFAAPASALTVSFPSVPGTGTRGSDYTFTAKIEITDDELLPIQSVDLQIYNTVDSSYTLTCSGLPLADSASETYTPAGGGTVIVSASTTKWQYMYGYGYALWEGEGYYFNNTYGYGYSGATASITYSVTWTSPTSWPIGSENKAKVTITANSNTFTKTSSTGFTLSSPATGAGGGAGGAAPSGVTYVYDDVTSAGEFTDTITVKSDDRNVELTIDEGTIGKTKTGRPLTKVTITEISKPPAPPADAEVIGLAYDLGPDGATFDPPINLTFEYDPGDLPTGVAEKNLKLAYWDGSEWVILQATVDTVANTITAEVSHFTEFTVIASTSPAAFTVDDLAIAPDEVATGQRVTISAVVTNTGDLSDSYTVTLKVDGAVVGTKRVTLDGGETQKVTFTTAKDAAGTYSVTIDGLQGTFMVKAPPAPPAPAPAAFDVSELSISPAQVDIGRMVTISATITNTGESSGSYTVTLKVNGVPVDTKRVTLDGGASQKVTFTVAQDAAGTYSITIDGLQGTFTVKAPLPPKPFNWWLTGGIIAAVVVVAVVVAVVVVMVARRRRA